MATIGGRIVNSPVENRLFRNAMHCIEWLRRPVPSLIVRWRRYGDDGIGAGFMCGVGLTSRSAEHDVSVMPFG